jgi:hypothetical protein
MKIIENRKCEVTIQRPDGSVETIIHPKIDYMTDNILAQMRAAMSNAGRGQILSYRNIDAIVDMEERDYHVSCERCGRMIDTRTAYSQIERYNGARVIAHYCDDCRQILTTVGDGEYTAMQDRAVSDDDNTLYHKED